MSTAFSRSLFELKTVFPHHERKLPSVPTWGHDDKARRYIGLLDAARVNGSWSELPELIRKITKHAPHRKLLIATATLDSEIVKHRTAVGAAPSAPVADTSHSFANLIDAIKRETAQQNPSTTWEDKIQSHASILWACWSAETAQDVWSSDSATSEELKSSYSLWTKICLVKSAYIQGAMNRAEEPSYQYVRRIIESDNGDPAFPPQLSYWTEHFLAEIASRRTMPDGEDTVTHAFRQWASLVSKGNQPPASQYGPVRSTPSRLSVWRSYYDHLSSLLQTRRDSPNRLQNDFVTELRKVEAAYENELLRTIQFPEAGDSNCVIEQWVEQVIRNWYALCGSDWLEKDLGAGGRNTVGRNVVDILYRAAMKTFQSTLILRRLFQVHKALADFDLAYRALDTYLELIERGRSRAAKSKQPPTGQDNDELVLLTIAEGIEGLCAFGHQDESERAYNLCLKLEALLKEVDPDAVLIGVDETVMNGVGDHVPTSVEHLSPSSRDTVHRALGVGKANWARWTPVNESRSSMQLGAIAHLRLATSQPISAAGKIRTTYALSLLLAETRQTEDAIAAIKTVLAQDASVTTERHLIERQLIPAWHLLSLLLSSRQDFDTAAQSCAAAFEQFPSPSILFGYDFGRAGSVERNLEKHSELALVDDMESDELLTILEVRMTELALTELGEGPELAVNSSNDLLTLYSRLFARLDPGAEEIVRNKPVQPPKSSAGTVKSLRGSLFHRKRVKDSGEIFNEKVNGSASIKTNTTRPQTQNTEAPTIRVTDEDDKHSPHKHHSLFRHSRDRPRHEKRHPTPSSPKQTPKKLTRSASKERKAQPVPSSEFSSQRQSFETSQEAPPSSTGTAETAQAHLSPILSAEEKERPATPPTMGVNSTENEFTPPAKQPLPPIQDNLAPHSQPPGQDTGLHSVPSSAPPVPRFPLAAAQKHALSILVKIWLLIAKLYRRGGMWDDSREATDEAAKAALKIESLVAAVESSARAFATAGWGSCGKSSDEVWADVYCERGECALALAMAKVEVDEKLQLDGMPGHSRAAVPDDQQPGQVDSDGIRDAVDMFEQCLMYFPNHASGIVGLSSVLLDYYERKVELGRKVDDGKAKTKMLASHSVDALSRGVRSSVSGQGAGQRWQSHDVNTSTSIRGHSTTAATQTSQQYTNENHTPAGRPSLAHAPTMTGLNFNPSSTPDDLLTLDSNLKKTPDNLNRLAARDRAYGLLSTLTKLGSGWDNSEAWYALARAHELGGEVERAKDILRWVIELEDTRPIRHWRCLGRGYVL